MEFVNDEATTLLVEVQDDVMGRLVEVVVIHALWLVGKDLFAIGVNWSHDGITLGGQVMVVKVLVLDIENVGSNSCRLEAFPFQFENHHAIVITSCEVVELRMSSQDPETVSVLPHLMDLHSSVHVPNTEGLVLRVGYQDLHSGVEYHT